MNVGIIGSGGREHAICYMLSKSKKVSKRDANMKLALPNGKRKLLLHTCCAPCCADIMLKLKESGIDYTLYFYNPNFQANAVDV